MDYIELRFPQKDNLIAKVRISGSKSESVRLVFINHLLGNKISISNLSNAEDAIIMQKCLLNIDKNKNLEDLCIINAENSAAVYRILISYLSFTPGNWNLCGTDRMNQRPIGDLVDSLFGLGAEIFYLEKEGYPPIKIKGKLLNGGCTSLNTSASSQFLTSLLLSSVLLKDGLNITLYGKSYSAGYCEMTIEIIKHFGVKCYKNNNQLNVFGTYKKIPHYNVESDWSSAAFWYQMAAISQSSNIELSNFIQNSLQGDAILCKLFVQLGVETIFKGNTIILSKTNNYTKYFDFDFSDYPDIVVPIAVVCAVKKIKSAFRGIKNLIYKESNRIASLKYNLSLIGVPLDVIDEDTFVLDGEQEPHEPLEAFKSFNDHRITMAFATLSLIFEKVVIENPNTIVKSYPNFWNDLISCNFLISRFSKP